MKKYYIIVGWFLLQNTFRNSVKVSNALHKPPCCNYNNMFEFFAEVFAVHDTSDTMAYWIVGQMKVPQLQLVFRQPAKIKFIKCCLLCLLKLIFYTTFTSKASIAFRILGYFVMWGFMARSSIFGIANCFVNNFMNVRRLSHFFSGFNSL